jgi:S1-C subfamily serine protease
LQSNRPGKIPAAPQLEERQYNRGMSLPDTFDAVRPAIVAFISKVAQPEGGQLPKFPDIVGTGFFVNQQGLVATNRHVAEVFTQLPRHPTTHSISAAAAIFLQPETIGGETVAGIVFADIRSWWILDKFDAGGEWYGEHMPDLAFVQLEVTDTPALSLDERPMAIRVGRSIATAGFPMGSVPILVHGKVTQLSPMLRRGVVSSVFPFVSPFPHGFTIDAMVQPGASGSPIFLEEEPVVIGMVESVLRDHTTTTLTSVEPAFSGTLSVPLSTNISIALAGHLLAKALRSFSENGQSNTVGLPTLHSLIPKDDTKYREINWEKFVLRD